MTTTDPETTRLRDALVEYVGSLPFDGVSNATVKLAVSDRLDALIAAVRAERSTDSSVRRSDEGRREVAALVAENRRLRDGAVMMRGHAEHHDCDFPPCAALDAALATPPTEARCQHPNAVDARNAIVQSGWYCPDCGALLPTPPTEARDDD